AAEEIVLGAGAVLAAPLHVVGVGARAGALRDHQFVDLVRLLLQLVLHMNRRGGDEGVNAAGVGRLDRLGAAVDVLERGAGKPAHDRVVGAAGDFLYRGEIALGGDGKAGLDDVDAHLIEQLGDFELLLVGHGGARALFAVAQGGVKDNDAVLLGLRWRSHDVGPSRRLRPSLGAPGFRALGPLSAQAQNARPALRGG